MQIILCPCCPQKKSFEIVLLEICKSYYKISNSVVNFLQSQNGRRVCQKYSETCKGNRLRPGNWVCLALLIVKWLYVVSLMSITLMISYIMLHCPCSVDVSFPDRTVRNSFDSLKMETEKIADCHIEASKGLNEIADRLQAFMEKQKKERTQVQ